MDQELKELLQRNLALAQENNKILRGMRTANRIGGLLKILYLAVFVVSLAFAYVYAKPYLEQATNTYNSLTETQKSFQDLLK